MMLPHHYRESSCLKNLFLNPEKLWQMSQRDLQWRACFCVSQSAFVVFFLEKRLLWVATNFSLADVLRHYRRCLCLTSLNPLTISLFSEARKNRAEALILTQGKVKNVLRKQRSIRIALRRCFTLKNKSV